MLNKRLFATISNKKQLTRAAFFGRLWPLVKERKIPWLCENTLGNVSMLSDLILDAFCFHPWWYATG